jgi:hypothetical protein
VLDAPSLNFGPGQGLGAQVLGKVQIRNAKEVFWEIVSVDQHGTPIIQRRKASDKRPGSKSMPTVSGMSRSVSGVPTFIDAKAGRVYLAPQMNRARSKPRYTGILDIPVARQRTIKTHGKFVRRAATKYHTFASAHFYRFLPRWKFPRETPWKIAENRTLKAGSSPPRAQ